MILSLMNSPELFRRNAAVDIRIEDFEEVPEFLALRFLAKFLIPAASASRSCSSSLTNVIEYRPRFAPGKSFAARSHSIWPH